MRLVLAIVSFVLAAVMLSFGIAQRTVLAPPDAVDLSVRTVGTAPVTIISGETLNSFPGRQTIDISGPARVSAAYGRYEDVMAWVGSASYNEITYDEETGVLVATAHRGGDTTVPDPVGSDLWLDDYQARGSLRLSVTLPEDIAFLIASDGMTPAPAVIGLRWPLDASTPAAGPLIIGGAVLLVIGIVLLITGIYRMRSGHGPKRKMPKVPKRPTIKTVRSPNRVPAKVGATSAILAVALATIAFVPSSGAVAEETPTPTPTPIPEEPKGPVPAVTGRQLDRIMARVLTTIGIADASLDAARAAERFAGPALALKEADYRLKEKDPAAIPDSPVIPDDGVIALSLPQQVPQDIAAWPRTIFVVVASPESLEDGTDREPIKTAPEVPPQLTESDPAVKPQEGEGEQPAEGEQPTEGDQAAEGEQPADGEGGTEAPVDLVPQTVPPVVMVLTQETPRDNYKVHYLMTLQTRIPEVAAPEVGAAILAPDTPLLSTPPSEVVPAFTDILIADKESASYREFDLREDNFSAAWGLEAQQAEQAAQAALESPNNMTFTTTPGEGPLVALSTLDSGALVVGTVQQVVDVTPAEAGAKVISQGEVYALTGVEKSEKGFSVTYMGELLFLVPPLDSTAPITVLAYAQGMLSASERE